MWLYNPDRSMSDKQWRSFESQWMKWYGWAIRSQLEPVKAVARMVKRHLGGIFHLGGLDRYPRAIAA